MLRNVTGIAVVAALSAWSAGVEAKPLTLRTADRIIDRAYVTELAGDYAGARAAVRDSMETAVLGEEAPARARLRHWLVGQAEREQAFRRHGKTPQGYWRAFATLSDAGFGRADLMWARALRDLPELQRDFEELARVDLRFERVVGTGELDPWEKHLEAKLRAYGVKAAPRVDSTRYEARINLDATDAKELMYRWQVTTEGSYLMRDLHDESRLIGRFSRRRREVRPTESQARAFAMRRVVDDLSRTLVFQVREAVLRDAATP